MKTATRSSSLYGVYISVAPGTSEASSTVSSRSTCRSDVSCSTSRGEKSTCPSGFAGRKSESLIITVSKYPALASCPASSSASTLPSSGTGVFSGSLPSAGASAGNMLLSTATRLTPGAKLTSEGIRVSTDITSMLAQALKPTHARSPRSKCFIDSVVKRFICQRGDKRARRQGARLSHSPCPLVCLSPRHVLSTRHQIIGTSSARGSSCTSCRCHRGRDRSVRWSARCGSARV